MDQSSILYIELKTNQENKGLAWIGKAEYSKSGQTVYFNGQAFKKLKSPSAQGNFFDLMTGDIYWISGVKKNGEDRHRLGSGKIKIDKCITQEYLSLLKLDRLDQTKFEIVNILPTDKSKFIVIENQSYK